MMTRRSAVALIILAVSLTACGPGAPGTLGAAPSIAAPTEAPAPTSAPVFTPTVLPPTANPTPTPPGQLFRDDFTAELGPGWTWENENPARWTITQDGWLQITGTDLSLLHDGTQDNVLWRDLPAGDFQITVHLKANPTDNFQQATIYMYENGTNYIALNRGYCGPCAAKGNGVFMEYKIGGQFGAYAAGVTATDVYLRLVSEANVISGYYALKPDAWTRLGRFGNYFTFKRVGLGVSNVDTQGINADLVGLFDYFEIDRP
jgi:hypothetical protein